MWPFPHVPVETYLAVIVLLALVLLAARHERRLRRRVRAASRDLSKDYDPPVRMFNSQGELPVRLSGAVAREYVTIYDRKGRPRRRIAVEPGTGRLVEAVFLAPGERMGADRETTWTG
jgi:hypothetical protein